MRFFGIGLAFLTAIAAAPLPASAAQLECLLIFYQPPGTHESLGVKVVPPSPIGPQIEAPTGGEPKSVSGKCMDALLQGPIVAGDYDRAAQAIRDSWPNLTRVDLDSPGGSVREALKVGRLLRKYLITADAWKAQTCASACALIWFGGIERAGTVGLHRPRIIDPDFANSPPDEAMALYRKVLSEIEAYLTEMEVPRPIIDQMLATSSADIRWINAEDDGLSRPPSYAEWEDASCPDRFNPTKVTLFDPCRGPLRAARVKQLSPP